MNTEYTINVHVTVDNTELRMYQGADILELWKITHTHPKPTANYVIGIVKLWEQRHDVEITDLQFHNDIATNAVSEEVRRLLREENPDEDTTETDM